uniref:BTB domain-containing protein n=1 Tax=Eutreptiella gymnastica TaxID=73025 RepID=A0A7S1IG39_9EUGL|mmetsp:Transcript_153656/g.268722  ORF Transcript_153656/g.268722 Transcript_153656/m.268722 type:complete len:387 (+) Transcript_153656:455-1615(+)
MQLCLECAESFVSHSTARPRSRAVDAVKKAVKNERNRLRRKIRQQQRLLYAIKNKDSDGVLKCLKDGAQADGTDKNGHPFVVHANSAYRYDANSPRVDGEWDANDVHRILTSVENEPPRIINVRGSKFYVHLPSPTHEPRDLGALPFMFGDKNGWSPPVVIECDPIVFSTILDFYHMGEHMQWTQEVTDREELLEDLYREADYYLLPKLMKITSEKIKVRAMQAKVEKAKSLVPFLQTICSEQYFYGRVDLLLTVGGESVEGFDGHAECSLEDFTNQVPWDDKATEAICTAILEEKKWVLRLYLIPSHVLDCKSWTANLEDDEDDEDAEQDEEDEGLYTLTRIQTMLDKQFEETYNKGFASFEFETDDDEHCITVRSSAASGMGQQ